MCRFGKRQIAKDAGRLLVSVRSSKPLADFIALRSTAAGFDYLLDSHYTS